MRHRDCEICRVQDWVGLEGTEGGVCVCFKCRTIHWLNGGCSDAQAAKDEEAFQTFLAGRADKEEWEQTC